MLNYDEEQSIFHSEIIDYYDVITEIEFDKLTNLLKEKSDNNNILSIFDDLSKFKNFWQNE